MDVAEPLAARRTGFAAPLRAGLPYLLVFALALLLPAFANDYWVVIGTRAAIYWVLVSGLTLVVGFAGQLAIGYVALLTLGAYTASVLVARTGFGPFVAFAASGVVGAVFGVIVGLPALRLRTFYFAMATLGFATIVTQIALAWQDVTGGGIGLPGPAMPAPFDTASGFFLLCLGVAAVCTWLTVNIAHSRFGRALVAIRDAEVAAESVGISKAAALSAVFLFSGALAGVAGGLFATLQSYITPDAFTFDLSVLFFIAILIGGRGSVFGPLLGTLLLTVLPEFAAPLVAWSTFLYAAMLLLIVVAVPGGIAQLLNVRDRRPIGAGRAMLPLPELLAGILKLDARQETLALRGVVMRFGGVRAIDGLDLELRPGEVHGLIGPNGSGKTTALNVICGFYAPQQGSVELGGRPLPVGDPRSRPRLGIARTFQTPRLVGEASVIDNVMIGGTLDAQAGFAAAMLRLPRSRRDETHLRERALRALQAIGLAGLAEVRADRLQHTELRFIEIARALMLRPRFLLLDEPGAGLSVGELDQLGELIRAVARCGTGVLVVEHHADLIFDICGRVTVLDLGRELASGSPAEIRAHREVVGAYLGA